MFVKIYMNFHWEAQRARGEAASLYNIVSKFSNARSLVSKYVLDRFLSSFLWLY